MCPKYNQEKSQEDVTLPKLTWLSFPSDIAHMRAPQGEACWQSIPG